MRSEFMPSSITISYVMILPKCNTKSHLKLNVLECDNANSLSSLKTRQTISTRDEASSSSSSLSVLFRLENTLQNSASSHLQYNCSFPRMSYSQAHFFLSPAEPTYTLYYNYTVGTLRTQAIYRFEFIVVFLQYWLRVKESILPYYLTYSCVEDMDSYFSYGANVNITISTEIRLRFADFSF